jgi:gluconate 2-dehydrogenase gamma chain
MTIPYSGNAADDVSTDGARAVADTAWEFLTAGEARTVEAVAARIIPSDVDRPGAREARVVRFIDRALADASGELRSCYRSGVAELDLFCQRRHGSSFVDLDEDGQDELLRAIDQSPAGPVGQESTEAAQALVNFFAVVREHTIQGMFCDPRYGGNHEAVGWRLIGFPGAQWGYTAEQMRPGFDATVIPIKTLADLRQEYPIIGGAGPGTEKGTGA